MQKASPGPYACDSVKNKMTKFVLDNQTLGLIQYFQNTTKVNVKDCIPTDDKITFVVSENMAAKAIGKSGINIKNLQKTMKKTIEVIEFSQDPLKFIKNFFRPAKITGLYIAEKSDGQKVIYMSPETDYGLIRTKIVRAKTFVKKYYAISDIIIKGQIEKDIKESVPAQ